MDISYSKAICLHVSTYENLIDKGDALVTFLNSLLDKFIPYLKNEIVIEIHKTNNRLQRLSYTENNINKISKMIKSQELNELLLVDYYKHSDDPYEDEITLPNVFPPNFCLSISLNLASTFPAHFQKNLIFPNEISFSLSDKVLDEHIPNAIKQEFIALFEQAIMLSNAAYGFITYETISGNTPMRTPFENYYKIEPFTKPGYNQHVRGYFWMNYLNIQHIAMLGGMDNVAERAPVFSQKKLASGVLLQLSDDINNYSNVQLKKLRDFLLPLFPPNFDKNIPFIFEGNPIHRLVE